MKTQATPQSLDWNYDDLLEMIPPFLELYSKRPLEDNEGGMKSPHMFALYCFLMKLRPETIIESGVWRGQGTWLIENTLPGVKLYCIDIDLSRRKYISNKATYYDKDFSAIDWSAISDKTKTLVFLDDHQNAYNRIKQAKEMQFKNLIFEDNYPPGRGDCYSLKKAFLHAGHDDDASTGLKKMIKRMLNRYPAGYVRPNANDAAYLNENLSVYYEFPPVFRSDRTRWGDEWIDDKYPTPRPLVDKDNIGNQNFSVFKKDSVHYTWMCLASLK